MIGFADVLIPAVTGVILAIFPRALVKPTSDQAADERNVAKFRKFGFVLCGVAVLYLLARLISA